MGLITHIHCLKLLSMTLVSPSHSPSAPLSGLSYTATNTIAMLVGNFYNLAPTLASGFATRFSMSPSPPAGLSFNTANGNIDGDPLTPSDLASYTVTAFGADPSNTATVTLHISVTQPLPCTVPSGYQCYGTATSTTAGTCPMASCLLGYVGGPSSPVCSISGGAWTFSGTPCTPNTGGAINHCC